MKKDSFFSLFLPHKCIFCGRILERHEYSDGFCSPCRRKLPWRDAVLNNDELAPSTVAIPLRYEDEVREALHRFKFNDASNYADTFGRILADEIKRAYSVSFDVLTWVPVSEKRLQTRGYDQALLLAKEVSGILRCDYTRTLRKIKDNREQSSQNAERRRDNVKGVYTMEKDCDVAGKRVLLIDDIYTTGETMNSAACVLLEAGAASVLGAAAARAGMEGKGRYARLDII